MIGFGGVIAAIGKVQLKIPFKDLRLVLDVDFLVLKETTPTLLSMEDMIQNELDISIQNILVTYDNRNQKLTPENLFLTHRCSRTDMQFICYTEEELRMIQTTFGHPYIQYMTSLLRRASEPDKLDTQTRKALEDIRKSWQIWRKNDCTPRRFKMTIGTDGIKFNSSIQVYTSSSIAVRSAIWLTKQRIFRLPCFYEIKARLKYEK